MTTLFEKFKECQYVYSTDSRNVTPGALFFCLKGDNFDAHAFIDDVIEKGARYVVVDDERFQNKEKCIKVDSVLACMQQLAAEYRNTFSIPVLVIGGSNGKTTTKELARVVLEKKYKVHSTFKNLNNHLGVPMSLLSMPLDCELAIIEIGANHLGEHTELLHIVQPTHVLVTNNGKDHLEGFGSIEGVRKANGEIYQYAEKHAIQVFVPDYEQDLVAISNTLNKIEYGYSSSSTFSFSSKGTMLAAVEHDGCVYQSNLFGDFNEKNIMTAVTVGIYFGCEIDAIKHAVQEYQPELLRSQIKIIDGVRYIVDCYNANPSSMSEALVNFKKYSTGKTAVILGDMLEMGKYANEEHVNTLNALKEFNFDINILVGDNFLYASKDFERGDSFYFFQNITDAKSFVSKLSLQGYDVLLKGSNGVKIKEVLS